MVSRGEVWWAVLPGDKSRPFVIVTRDSAIPVVNGVIAIPASRTIRGLVTEVLLDEDDGMPAPCAINADCTTLVEHHRFDRRICTLSPPRMREVCRALLAATACA